MITLCTEGRQPLLGRLMRRTAAVASTYVEPTELGSEVERCWREIPKHYPEVSVLAFQVMPDHIHGILFVTHEMAVHLGKVINGFKVGCNRAYRRLVLGSSEAMPQKQEQEDRIGRQRLAVEKGRNSEAVSTQSMACSLRRAIMTAC